MPGASTAPPPVTNIRGLGHRRPRHPARNAVALLVRELVTFPPAQVADVASTVTDGVPAHLVAGWHRIDITLVHRLALLCRAVQTGTGFDFRAWPALHSRTHGDPALVLHDVLHSRPA